MSAPGGPTSLLWKRLDCPGHEACRMTVSLDGTCIEGRAVFADPAGVASLSYTAELDPDWHTRTARVAGWAGKSAIDITVTRSATGWQINGADCPEFDGLIDIDLGFTPSTNTIAIRRMSLAVGESRDTTAVWLDTGDWQFRRLDQSYTRTGHYTYLYRSPAHGYEAALTVDEGGLVSEYPGLWSRVPDLYG